MPVNTCYFLPTPNQHVFYLACLTIKNGHLGDNKCLTMTKFELGNIEKNKLRIITF